MLRKRNHDCTRLWETVGDRKAGRRTIRAAGLLAAGCGALTLGIAQPAFAGEEPPGCNFAGVSLQIGPVGTVQDGDTIEYVLIIQVLSPSCNMENVTLTFWPPNVDRAVNCDSPNGTVIASGLTIGQDDPALIFTSADNPILGYIVDHADEDINNIVNAFACVIGDSQTDPPPPAQTFAFAPIPNLVIHPDIAIDKEADLSRICEGVETRVNYTYTVTNPGDVDLELVNVTDDMCGPVIFSGGDTDGDSELDLTETWTYTCNAFISEETTNIATVTAQDTILGKEVFDTATVTVEANENPTCDIKATACPYPVDLTVNPTGGRKPYP